MDAQEDKKVDDVSEGKKFGPCMNCGYPRTAHDWKIPGRYCSNYLARDPAPAQPVADAQGETAQGEANPCYCGKDACVGVDSIKAGYFCKRAEPSQQEDAPQPQQEKAACPTCGDAGTGCNQFGCWMNAPSQSQPAESDGFQSELDAAWKKYRTLSKGEFDPQARMHFTNGFLASRQSLPGFEEYLSMKVRAEAAEAKQQSLLAEYSDSFQQLGVSSLSELVARYDAKLSSLLAQKPEASAEDNLECVHCGVYRKYWATSPKCLGDKHTGEGYEKSLRAPQIDHLAWISQALEVVQLYRNGYAPHDVADGLLEKYRQWDVPEKYRLSEIAKVQR